MNFNTIAIYSLLAASSDAAFLRSGAGLGVGGGCKEGQIKVVNNCGSSTTLKHCDGKGLTTTLQSGCRNLPGWPGAGQRIWVGSDDSECGSNGNTLFEYTYNSTNSELFWDVSLLSGYNYPVKVENNSNKLLDVTGPRCGSVNGGLYPCAQVNNGTCAQHKTLWPYCEGCSNTPSCCDMRDSNHDCSQKAIFSPSMVLTFCPKQESFSLDADAFVQSY